MTLARRDVRNEGASVLRAGACWIMFLTFDRVVRGCKVLWQQRGLFISFPFFFVLFFFLDFLALLLSVYQSFVLSTQFPSSLCLRGVQPPRRQYLSHPINKY